jgi:hypothetical protein
VFIVPTQCPGIGSSLEIFDNGYLTFLTVVGIWCTGSPNFLNNGIFIPAPGQSTTLLRPANVLFPQGGRFGIFSIDIADEFFGVNIAGPLTFTGIRGMGLPPVTQTFQFTPQSGAPAYTRFSFNSDFADIASLEFPLQGAVGGATPAYQFGNITYSITPEPSEVVLLATGLLTLVRFQRARRRGRREL